MVQILLVLLKVAFFQSPLFANQNLACTDLAKATCENQRVDKGESRVEGLISVIQKNYTNAVQEGFRKSPSIEKFVSKTGILKPSECSDKTKNSPKCIQKIKSEIDRVANEVRNNVLGKPSIYDDPNVARPEDMFSLYEGIAADVASETVAKSTSAIARIDNLFQKARTAMIGLVGNIAVDPSKTAMIERLESIKLSNEECTGERSDAKFFLNTTAYYSSEGHVFAFCPRAFLADMTDTQIAFIIGHELAHSIDPCHAALPVGKRSALNHQPFIDYNSNSKSSYEARIAQYPFHNQLNCLRQPASSNSPVPTTNVELNEMSNTQFYDHLCDADPINEVFCDWIGTQVATMILEKIHAAKSKSQIQSEYASVFTTKCKEQRRPTDTHPPVERRANGIIGSNPDVRKSMGCSIVDGKNVHCHPPQTGSKEILQDSKDASSDGVKK